VGKRRVRTRNFLDGNPAGLPGTAAQGISFSGYGIFFLAGGLFL